MFCNQLGEKAGYLSIEVGTVPQRMANYCKDITQFTASNRGFVVHMLMFSRYVEGKTRYCVQKNQLPPQRILSLFSSAFQNKFHDTDDIQISLRF